MTAASDGAPPGACSRWPHRRRERGMMTFQAGAELASMASARPKSRLGGTSSFG
jgi:hypothetical protein